MRKLSPQPGKLHKVPILLPPEERAKLNQLVAHAVAHNVMAHGSRVIRTLILMTEPGPEFLKAVAAMDEKEREEYREARRRGTSGKKDDFYPITPLLPPAEWKKLAQLGQYAASKEIEAHTGRIVRTLILMTKPGPEFLKAVTAVDEKERKAPHAGKRRRD